MSEGSLTGVLVALVVIVAAGGAVYLAFRRPSVRAGEDRYLQALELWVAGERRAAADLLRRVVQDDPDAIDPFLQLGILLRELGDPQRAAILHRSLTVRPDLGNRKKVTVGLALADDLVALGHWAEAAAVLDQLEPRAGGLARYVWLRFAERHGRGELPEAARTLKRAMRHGPVEDRPAFREAYGRYQLDRALEHARRHEGAPAEARLKDVQDLPEAATRAAYVRALLAAQRGDAAAAVEAVTDAMLDRPEDLSVVWPSLQEVLLETGQYDRIVPILENATSESEAPPRLWVALALLYEKLGRRDRAVRLLEAKRGDPRFTPDVAAPYLRLLVADEGSPDLQAVWGALAPPDARERSSRWRCPSCGRIDEAVRWFCPQCRNFGDYVKAGRNSAVTAGVEPAPAAPVRF
ncbi:MAG: tetratricopeptide repeat protein [Candidatus Krumholzibacteriia bacterium]